MASDEWLTSEREHEYRMAQLAATQADDERRDRRWRVEQWTTRVGYIVAGLTIAAIVLGITWFIWQSVGASRDAQARLEQACIERGGSWTNLGSSSGSKSCYQIGSVEEVNSQ